MYGCLLFGGRIHLVNWNIGGKYTYWAKGICLPDSVHAKVKKLGYRFI